MKKVTLIISVFCLMLINLNAQNFALQLDGLNDKIGVADAPELNPVTSFTVEAWIKADYWESNVYAGSIISKQATSPDRSYCLTVGQGGKAEFTVSIEGLWVTATTDPIMGLYSWYHLAGVYDGSSVKIYINGILQTETPCSGTHGASTGTILYMGDNPTWGGRNFQGTIDEIRIWDTSRTETEIVDNYTGELTGTEDRLVAYWNFNEGTGSTVTDVTGNGNNGTMLNMTPASDWVPGFEPATKDVGVVRIAAPYQIGPAYTTSEAVQVEIKNFSTQDATGFDVVYEINGGSPVTETISAVIPPFGTYIHTFSGAENLLGISTIDIKSYTAHSEDQNHFNDTLSTSISPVENQVLFNANQHNIVAYGQINTVLYSVAGDLSGYSQILLHVDLTCPAGGCDPWDQAGMVFLKKGLEQYELARYITPYGKACGGWTYDITDFKSLLSGSSEFVSYVQVWGASGWLVTVEIELVPGTPEWDYIKIDKLWDAEHLVYGDPGVSHDLPVFTQTIHENAQKAKVRMTITGHGQGNTDNAAEFSHVVHNLWVSGSPTFAHDFWKDDCGSNSCSDQYGTWTLSRSGWCPGQDVQPDYFDLDGYFTPGADIDLDYVLQDYTNLLNTGYNDGSHTEPFYRIRAYLVTYSDSPLTEITESSKDNSISIYPNPASDNLTIRINESLDSGVKILVFNQQGKLMLSKDSKFVSGAESIEISGLSSGLYHIRIVTGGKVKAMNFIKL